MSEVDEPDGRPQLRVVIADDQKLFSDALASAVRQQGWEVCGTAINLAECVALVKEHQPEVLLLDVCFPGASGIEAIPAVGATSPTTAIIMLSAMGDGTTVAAALAAGAAGFASKSEELESIIDVVARVRGGELVVHSFGAAEVPGRIGGHRPLLDLLTSREREVLDHLVEGHSMAMIAQALGISYSTTRSHTQNVLMKLGVHSQVQAVAYAVAHGARPSGRSAVV